MRSLQFPRAAGVALLALVLAPGLIWSDERDPEPEKGSSIEARRKYKEFFDRALITVTEERLEAGPQGGVPARRS